MLLYLASNCWAFLSSIVSKGDLGTLISSDLSIVECVTDVVRIEYAVFISFDLAFAGNLVL